MTAKVTGLSAKCLNFVQNAVVIETAQAKQFLSGALLDEGVRQAEVQHRHRNQSGNRQ